MDLWRSLAGMMDVELTSAEPEAALEAINSAGIPLFHVQQDSPLTYRFYMFRKDYAYIARLCEKRGERLRIRRRQGIYWTVKGLLRRPVLLLGGGLLLALVLFLPTRVLFVTVEGNQTVPRKQILAAAEECGIGFGASRRQVRSERVKNALLLAVPELQWAGVNTDGCVATISVRERAQNQTTSPGREVASIVAARDGLILSGTVTNGNGLFQVGQVVQEGQVLISGYTDCGICIQATRAEGEVFAQTNRKLEVITPASWVLRTEETGSNWKVSLLLGKKRINLWKGSGIWDATCGRMYQEYYVTLPGGFRLPIALCVENYTLWENQEAAKEEASAQEELREYARAYLTEQMIAGSLLNRTEAVFLEKGCYRLRGEYVCKEMIGRVRQEQIGETNGEIG